MMGPDQLGRLLDEHAAALVLYARQWCAAPDDVVQEAFIKLAAHDPNEPVPWLYKVVRNAARSAGRSARRRLHYEKEAASRASVWFVPAVAARLDQEAATAALRELPDELREIIIAHLWGGLTFEQIGEVTAISSSTAHRWYLAGLSALRERLGVPCPKTSATRK
jgi:RNA polymerase sigma-70 factor (ECF subfamily)